MHTAWGVALMMLAAPLGAIGRRIDGGVLETWTGRKWGKLVTRLCLAVALALPMHLAGLPALPTLAFVGATWIGASMGMWSGLGMGRAADSGGVPVSLGAWIAAAGFMTLYGLGAVAPSALALWWFGFSPWPLLAAGLLCAPCYELAFRRPLHIPALGCLAVDPPPSAELLWGAVRGIAGVATVLIGAGAPGSEALLAFVRGGL